MKKIALILSATAVLSSCGVYTNYERPAEVRTENLVGELPLSDTETLPAWNTFFTDENLQQHIERALRQNIDLQTAQLRVTEAEAALRSAKLAFLPSLALTPSGTMSSFDGSTPSKVYNLGAAASWQIDVFGSLRNAKKVSETQVGQMRAYEQAVQTQVIAAVATYYYTLQMLDEQLSIAQQTDVLWGNYVKTVRALKEAGGATQASVAQAEANHYNVKTTVADLKQQIHEVENAFCVLLGEAVGTEDIVRTASDDKPYIISPIPLSALANRPDVRQSEQALAAAFYTTNMARAAFYPSINLTGSAGWTNSAGSMIVNPGKFLWSAVASLTQPLFQNGKLMAQLKISKAQQEEAQLAFQKSLLVAGQEVNNALTQWQTATDKAALYEAQVVAANSALESTQLLMAHSSTTTYLEVLTAQQTLLSAQLSAVSARYNVTASAISLYQALGGGQSSN